jgi:hypothetical protein
LQGKNKQKKGVDEIVAMESMDSTGRVCKPWTDAIGIRAGSVLFTFLPDSSVTLTVVIGVDVTVSVIVVVVVAVSVVVGEVVVEVVEVTVTVVMPR